MNPELIKELFQKYKNGTCTPEEIALLEKTFLLYLRAQDTVPDEQQIKTAGERVRGRLADHIRHDLLRKRLRTRRVYLTAAVLLVSISIGFIIWQLGGGNDREQGNLAAMDVKPGGNKAMLTLADGQTVNLNEAQQGIIVGDGITYVDGSPVFRELGNRKTREQRHGRPRSLTLTTPKGGTYQVTLPDGTHVWLNASSVLKYPSQFGTDERIVKIEGEGYFAVAKDKKRPFKVLAAGQEVVVLGTAFNISAYPDENETATTLVEGSVKIVSLANEKVSKLRPGQQARLTQTGLHVHEVDIEEFTAWKEGYFVFNDADIYSILKKLARWYDIEIDDNIKPTEDLFTGKIPRNASLKSALRIVGRTSGMSFQLMDNKLVLSK
ncbi:FecR family protein [Parapedobacter sp. GCM10030251]|uniref:FecR family protein n=1 Tax=Parapedobacter sp. GCM10030251 TaxID=3273419 RepID=UPI003614A342